MTFADKILAFNEQLEFPSELPEGIRVMNPFQDAVIREITSLFYHKYYNDSSTRFLILGINPGRFGAGITGIPFTDTKRLKQFCGTSFPGKESHEPSSVFVYDMITAYGGADAFYKKFYIGAVCPLGFTRRGENGKELNYNYYDSVELTKRSLPFIRENLLKQIEFGINKEVCFCLGGGKNFAFLDALNSEQHYFRKIIPLEHPRFIMQYKAKQVGSYIRKYLEAFRESGIG